MPAVTYLTEKYPDNEFKKEIIAFFGTLKMFCEVSDLDYRVVYRVVNCKPCTKDDIRIVLDKWSSYAPEFIDVRLNNILDGTQLPTLDDFKWLSDIYLDYRIAISTTIDE